VCVCVCGVDNPDAIDGRVKRLMPSTIPLQRRKFESGRRNKKKKEKNMARREEVVMMMLNFSTFLDESS